jgi:hypothetical protein
MRQLMEDSKKRIAKECTKWMSQIWILQDIITEVTSHF